MKFIADLHIHSRFSRACSTQLNPQSLYKWCQLKGINVIATGDFTHPEWFKELKENLVEAEVGFLKLKPEIALRIDAEIPPKCRGDARFVLESEISCIYKKNNRVRKVHHLVYSPSFKVAELVNKRLEKIGNIRFDGRPILGIDSKNLLEILLSISEEIYLIPAHAWTPHFSIFGSESGFDSIEECFEDLSKYIFSIETGLSSDPPMNWRLSALDKITLMSNSDAHSLEKIAREANFFDAEFSYQGIFSALKKQKNNLLLKTFEFFPEEGKYHVDGHRKCGVRLLPKETMKNKNLCPKCKSPVTIGVLHRVEKLADRPAFAKATAGRPEGIKPEGAADFESLVPLKEILGEVLKTGPQSVKVDREYFNLLNRFGNEIYILRELPISEIENMDMHHLAIAIERMRKGEVKINPGFDGEYGKISLLSSKDFERADQLMLF